MELVSKNSPRTKTQSAFYLIPENPKTRIVFDVYLMAVLEDHMRLKF